MTDSVCFALVRDERLETYSFSTGYRYFISYRYKIAGNLFSPLAYKNKIPQAKRLKYFILVRDERLELPTFSV